MAPKEKKQNAHNGKQGNATRLEFFVALQYLLEKCPDKNHTSKTVDLQKYAEDNYGILLDRRRVNDIFISLTDLTHKNPSVLPYKVFQVGDKPRFYIEKTLFSEKEIEYIARAIQNDDSISKVKADRYINSFINKSCNASQKEKISKKLKRVEIIKPRISDVEMQNKEYLEYLRDNTLRFYFKINGFVRSSDLADRSAIREFRENDRKGYNAGIVYDLIHLNKKEVDVCIYLPDLRSAVVAHLDDVILDLTREPTEQWSNVDYRIGDGSIELDDWLKKYYKGETGLVNEITFKFYVGPNQETLHARKKSFQEFFKEEMKYELVERKVETENALGEKTTIIAVDAVVKVKCNYQAFRKWYWEAYDKPYDNTVILSPASLNNRLLNTITRRFNRRLEKYGIDSENGRAEREEMQKRLEEIRKRRREREENEQSQPSN